MFEGALIPRSFQRFAGESISAVAAVLGGRARRPAARASRPRHCVRGCVGLARGRDVAVGLQRGDLAHACVAGGRC